MSVKMDNYISTLKCKFELQCWKQLWNASRHVVFGSIVQRVLVDFVQIEIRSCVCNAKHVLGRFWNANFKHALGNFDMQFDHASLTAHFTCTVFNTIGTASWNSNSNCSFEVWWFVKSSNLNCCVLLTPNSQNFFKFEFLIVVLPGEY